MVTVTPSNQSQLPNTSAVFTCSIISFSTPPNVTWTTTALNDMLDQPELVAESEVGMYTSVLSLDKILPDDNGSYTCTVTNEGGITNDIGILNVISEQKERE